MKVSHHPGDETLLRYAAGTLEAGPALVVAAHLEGCPICRRRFAEFEAVGGAILEEMPAELLKRDALARVLERLDLEPSTPENAPAGAKGHGLAGLELPAALRHCVIGSWRWLAPGFRWSRVTVPGNPEARVVLLEGKAGLRLPAHGHAGAEFVQVLSGSLSDERGQYFPGDFDEAGVDVDHRPVVDPDSECVCLAALEGDTLLHSRVGRLLWPFIGF